MLSHTDALGRYICRNVGSLHAWYCTKAVSKAERPDKHQHGWQRPVLKVAVACIVHRYGLR